jgi:hypothetical protein
MYSQVAVHSDGEVLLLISGHTLIEDAPERGGAHDFRGEARRAAAFAPCGNQIRGLPSTGLLWRRRTSLVKLNPSRLRACR